MDGECRKIINFMGAKSVYDYFATRTALRGRHAGELKRHAPEPICADGRAGVRVAVYIDAENMGSCFVPQVIDACRNRGDIVSAQAFGPQELLGSAPWLRCMEEYDVRPVLCVGCKKGKNSVDINMVVRLMDALRDPDIDVYVVVSSDTDFAPVVRRIRQEGKRVVGIGRKSSSSSYQQDFDEFISVQEKSRAAKTPALTEVMCVIDEGVSKRACKSGWCALSTVSTLLYERLPGFSPKKYGAKNVSSLVRSLGCYELQRDGKNNFNIRAKAS